MIKTNESDTTEIPKSLSMQDKSTKIPYSLKNDYLFIALMNSHQYTLKMLICSLLGMQMTDIVSLEIQNPIKVGEVIESKTFILDVHVLLNHNVCIDIELQVVDYKNWPERSLGYLCRTYDNLNKGMDYIETKPAIHVSILDYTLFAEYPEFFAEYRMQNVKNHHDYTGKFKLYVLDLSKVDLATDADKANHLDVWTRIFQAKTWGDLMAVAAQYQSFEPTIEEIERLQADERVRLQCEARERSMIHERVTKELLAKQAAQLQEQAVQMKEQAVQLETKDVQLEEQAAQLQEQAVQMKEQAVQLGEKDAQIEQLKAQLALLTGNP